MLLFIYFICFIECTLTVFIWAILFLTKAIDNVYSTSNVILVEAGRFPSVEILNTVESHVASDDNNSYVKVRMCFTV